MENKIKIDAEDLPEGEKEMLSQALEELVETDVPLTVEISLVGKEEIQRLNREIRNKDAVTDVLSFPELNLKAGDKVTCSPFDALDEEGRLILGSVAICTERAREQASEFGHSEKREIYYLAVHGILHCLGYDHEEEEDRAKMREREERVMQKMNLGEGSMRCGTVAVVGKANAGKSTLLNVLMGEKVSIVSPKPQTTRDRILCIFNREEGQIVFADTPGVYRGKSELASLMMRTVENTAKEVDAILYVFDGHLGVEEGDIALMKKFMGLGLPMLIAYTKIDIMEKERILEDVKKLFEAGVTADVCPISARKGQNLDKLTKALFSLLPEGEPLYPDDIVSDRSEKFMIAEIMREKILLKYDKEIPHGVAIVINRFEKGENGVYHIDLDIVCEKRNHKAILIGKGGAALKETASFARKDMEKFLGSKVFLSVYVKVKEDWRDRGKYLKEFGYSDGE